MGRQSWTAKTERERMSLWQWLRLAACLGLTSGFFTLVLGEWPWQGQLVVAALGGILIWVMLEVLWLIWKDERAAASPDAARAAPRSPAAERVTRGAARRETASPLSAR